MSEMTNITTEASDSPVSNKTVLRLDDVRKSFGNTQVLRGISFDIHQHEVVALLGPSGSGKSTLMKCVNLLEQVDDGQIWLGNTDITDPRADQDKIRARIGVVFQQFNLFNNLTILENVTISLKKVKKVPAPAAEEKARALLRRVGLEDKADAYPAQLSGGQKQRIAIAGVLAMEPECIVLDEATAMLDPRGREQVMQTIHYLNENMGITVVSITHYMEEAAQADRVLVMSKGNVVMEGTPKEVFSQTEKVRALRLDVPQAAELRDELVKAGIPMPEGIIDTGACAQALYELLK